jgi:hypothetical protein
VLVQTPLNSYYALAWDVLRVYGVGKTIKYGLKTSAKVLDSHGTRVYAWEVEEEKVKSSMARRRAAEMQDASPPWQPEH